MQAKDIMVPVTVFLRPQSSVREAVLAFRRTRLAGIPVINDEGLLIGIFTRSNLYECLLRENTLETSIAPYYLKDVMYFREDKTFHNLAELIMWLRNVRIGQTPVIDLTGRPVGIITQAWAVMHLLDQLELLYDELSSVFQQIPCGLVVTDEQGVINLVSTYLHQLLPEIEVGGRVEELLPGLPFKEIIAGYRYGPQKLQHRSLHLIVQGMPIVHIGKTKGAILILQDADEIKAAMKQKKDGVLKNVLARPNLERDQLSRLNGTKYTIDSFIGKSRSVMEVKHQALQAAPGSSTILIYGESGTGKELLAHAIHNASERFKRPFVKVNCAAIPVELAEAELFGYEGGAFTGALRHGKPGKFELADGGTIFLDEIGEMPLVLQSKLLRVIQEKEVERIGGGRPKEIDVRIIAATNRDLYKLTREGKFRQDLFYRLNVLVLTVPPLRERREDIDMLVDFFLNKFNALLGKAVEGVTDEVMRFFKSYHWPGNVRELEHMLERAMNYCKYGLIQMDDLGMHNPENSAGNERGFGLALAEVTREAIIKALEITGGNKSRAARMLGISRATLYEKLKEMKGEAG